MVGGAEAAVTEEGRAGIIHVDHAGEARINQFDREVAVVWRAEVIDVIGSRGGGRGTAGDRAAAAVLGERVVVGSTVDVVHSEDGHGARQGLGAGAVIRVGQVQLIDEQRELEVVVGAGVVVDADAVGLARRQGDVEKDGTGAAWGPDAVNERIQRILDVDGELPIAGAQRGVVPGGQADAIRGRAARREAVEDVWAVHVGIDGWKSPPAVVDVIRGQDRRSIHDDGGRRADERRLERAVIGRRRGQSQGGWDEEAEERQGRHRAWSQGCLYRSHGHSPCKCVAS
jgi:hypothetical protein